MAWFDPAWQKRKKITLAAAEVDANLTDYLATVSLLDADIQQATQVAGEDVVFTQSDGSTQIPHYLQRRRQVTNDGCWSWFSSPEAVYYNNATYWSSIGRTGDVIVTRYDHNDGTVSEFVLDTGFEADDHNSGVVYARTDGRILVMWGGHNLNSELYYRISTNAEDVSSWGSKQTLTLSNNTTYQNLAYLSSNNTLYCFYRSPNDTWSYITSTDEGDTWDTTENVFWSISGAQVYCVFEPYGTSQIHVAATDAHPNNDTENPSVYHFYLEDQSGTDTWHQSDGSTISTPITTSNATLVYDGSTEEAWIWDIALDNNGHPHILFPTFPSFTDHRYKVASWDGTSWSSPTEITPAGQYLESGEQAYSGGMVFDRSDGSLSTVYLVRESAGIWNLERWVEDGGWAKDADITSATASSDTAQARPVSPRGQVAGTRLQVLWWSGRYQDYLNFACAIYGYPEPLHSAYVKVPSVSASTDTEIFVYYDNPSALNQEDQAGTFSDYDFALTMQMKPGTRKVENLAGGDKGSVEFLEELTKEYRGGDPNSIAPWVLNATGNRGQVRDISYDMAGKTAFTLEAIASHDGSGSNKHTIASNWNTQVLWRIDPGSTDLEGFINDGSTVGGGSGLNVSVNDDHFLSMAFDTTDLRAQVDGVDAQIATTGSALSSTASNDMYYGNTPHTASNELSGRIGTLRAANIKRSLEYGTTTRANLFSYNSFVSVGAEEVDSGESVTLTGTLTATSTTAGALALQMELLSTLQAQSTTQGAIDLQPALSGQASGQSTLAGAVDAQPGLSGASAGTSTLAGEIDAQPGLSGSITGTSTLSGALSLLGEMLLSGAVEGTSSTQGSLSLLMELGGTVTGESQVSGAVSVLQGLQGQVNATSTASGALSTLGQMLLSGTIAGVSQTSGRLIVDQGLQGEVEASSELLGAAYMELALSGQTQAASELSGLLSGVGARYLKAESVALRAALEAAVKVKSH